MSCNSNNHEQNSFYQLCWDPDVSSLWLPACIPWFRVCQKLRSDTDREKWQWSERLDEDQTAHCNIKLQHCNTNVWEEVMFEVQWRDVRCCLTRMSKHTSWPAIASQNINFKIKHGIQLEIRWCDTKHRSCTASQNVESMHVHVNNPWHSIGN